MSYPANAQRGKYVGNVRLSSGQTVSLDVPVVALVRRATEIVSLFEGTSLTNGEAQVTITVGTNGTGQSWVHIPYGFTVLHASLGVVGATTNLLNPTIDIGADGWVEWAFSGKFDIGVVVRDLEGAFNRYLEERVPGPTGIDVPILVTGNANEQMQLGGVQLYLEAVPNELSSPQRLPNGRVQVSLLGQPGYRYTIQASTNLVNWENLATLPVTKPVTPFVDATASGYSQRFYRATLLP